MRITDAISNNYICTPPLVAYSKPQALSEAKLEPLGDIFILGKALKNTAANAKLDTGKTPGIYAGDPLPGTLMPGPPQPVSALPAALQLNTPDPQKPGGQPAVQTPASLKPGGRPVSQTPGGQPAASNTAPSDPCRQESESAGQARRPTLRDMHKAYFAGNSVPASIPILTDEDVTLACFGPNHHYESSLTARKGVLKGDAGIIQPFASAVKAHRMFEKYLGRDLNYDTPDGRLLIEIGHPDGIKAGPYTSQDGIIFGEIGAKDPDAVAHELGHAILEAHRKYSWTDNASSAAHEAFADTTAFLSALQDEDAIKDMAQKLPQGFPPAAAMIAEGSTELSPYPIPSGMGLRCIAAEPPDYPIKPYEECHQSSHRFTGAFYKILKEYAESLTSDKCHLETALKESRDKLGSQFARLLDELPQKETISMAELAQCLISIDEKEGAKLTPLYRKHFTATCLLEAENSL